MSEQVATEVLAASLGLVGTEKRIVRVELLRQRAEDYVRQSRALAEGAIRFRLSERTVRMDGATAVIYVVTACRAEGRQ